MFEWLEPADGPVIEGLEKYELVASGKGYRDLRILPGFTRQGERLSRWSFTPEQRQAIAAGADVLLEVLTFNTALQPVRMAVTDKPAPEIFMEGYRLYNIEVHKMLKDIPEPHRSGEGK